MISIFRVVLGQNLGFWSPELWVPLMPPKKWENFFSTKCVHWTGCFIWLSLDILMGATWLYYQFLAVAPRKWPQGGHFGPHIFWRKTHMSSKIRWQFSHEPPKYVSLGQNTKKFRLRRTFFFSILIVPAFRMNVRGRQSIQWSCCNIVSLRVRIQYMTDFSVFLE